MGSEPPSGFLSSVSDIFVGVLCLYYFRSSIDIVFGVNISRARVTFFFEGSRTRLGVKIVGAL